MQAELRSAHERVEQNAEAIAFQDGDRAEQRIANAAADSVMKFLHRENTQNSAWSAFNSFMMWRLTYLLRAVYTEDLYAEFVCKYLRTQHICCRSRYYIQMSLQFYWYLVSPCGLTGHS